MQNASHTGAAVQAPSTPEVRVRALPAGAGPTHVGLDLTGR